MQLVPQIQDTWLTWHIPEVTKFPYPTGICQKEFMCATFPNFYLKTWIRMPILLTMIRDWNIRDEVIPLLDNKKFSAKWAG